jgi:hypothetical protein
MKELDSRYKQILFGNPMLSHDVIDFRICITRWLRGFPRNRILNRLKPANYAFRIQIRNDRYDRRLS